VVGELISHSTHAHGAQAVMAEASTDSAAITEARVAVSVHVLVASSFSRSGLILQWSCVGLSTR
jgi:hypothetical protein